MAEEKKLENDFFFQEVIKKTKTGITFPKELREALFDEDSDVYFKLVVPNEKKKIILEIISDTEAKELSEEISKSKPKVEKKTLVKKKAKGVSEKIAPNWSEYFVYDFKNREKVLFH